GENPHVNYEPSARHGAVPARPAGKPHTPFVSVRVVRETIARESNFAQAGEGWRAFEAWERDEPVANSVAALWPCGADIQQRVLRVLAELFQPLLHRALELRVVPGDDLLRPVLALDVGRHALVLDREPPLAREEAEARGDHRPAVDEGRRVGGGHEPAPRAH